MKKARITNVWVLAAISTIGGALFGFDISSMSAIIGTDQYLEYFNSPDSDLQGGITASMPAGSFAGALISGFISDRLGRRGALHTAVAIWCVGCVLVAASQNVAMLVVGRVINGLCVGIASAQVPVFISELAKADMRGRLVGLQQWAITWGITIMFYISFGCSYITGSTAAFRIPWAVQAVPALLLSFLLLFCPESPRWLAQHERWDDAWDVLADLHGKGQHNDPVVLAEYNELKEAVEMDRNAASIGFVALFKPKMIYRTHLAISVQIWSQLTGMNVMMYYINYIFLMAGLTDNSNLISSSIQYVINVVMTVPGLFALDYVGRRTMLLGGAACMFTCLCIVGGVMATYGNYYVDPNVTSVRWQVEGTPSKVVIAFTYLFVASFAPTWGPASWTYAPEVLPNDLRAKGMSLAACGNWAFNFALAYFVPPSFENIQWKTYFVFAAFCAAMWIHVFFAFHETKNHSLEEMTLMFESKVPAWRSRGYKPKISEDVERAAQGNIPGRGLRVADDDTSDKMPEKGSSQNDL